MPLIDPRAIKCAIYLYPTKRAAEQGDAAGGSGFLVGVRSEALSDTISYCYAVTNRHIITQGHGSPVVRLNCRSGPPDIIEFDVSDWEPHEGGADISVVPCKLNTSRHDHLAITERMFITKDIVKEWAVGPGDDVFMISRLSMNEGKARNAPAARFGNIAQMPIPGEPIPDGFGGQESFAVDMRSIPGHSGSPVLLHIPPWSVRPIDADDISKGWRQPRLEQHQWLLGVDWCHLPYIKRVLDAHGNKTKQSVKLNSGIAGVVPAWRLRELLYSDKLVAQRREWDEWNVKQRELAATANLDAMTGPTTTVADEGSEPSTKADNPSHKEDFTTLVSAAAKKRKPAG